MGLFSKEACTFCGTEVGMLKRSKLATKEYICNDCKRKTNYFAKMSYTTREQAANMMETLGQIEEEFQAAFEAAEGRFARAEASYNTWTLGSTRVHYRCNTTTGGFQIRLNDTDRYEHVPVFWFDTMIPYEFRTADDTFTEMRRAKAMKEDAEYVTVEERKGEDGKVTHCTLTIPYDDPCIREIRFDSDVHRDEEVQAFHDLAERINSDRHVWISRGIHDAEQKNKMHLRNLGDTAAAAFKAAVKGEDVTEAVKKGMETANDIDEGKVKRGFFGKLLKK